MPTNKPLTSAISLQPLSYYIYRTNNEQSLRLSIIWPSTAAESAYRLTAQKTCQPQNKISVIFNGSFMRPWRRSVFIMFEMDSSVRHLLVVYFIFQRRKSMNQVQAIQEKKTQKKGTSSGRFVIFMRCIIVFYECHLIKPNKNVIQLFSTTMMIVHIGSLKV